MAVSNMPAQSEARPVDMRGRLGAAAVYAAGAVLYFVAREALGMEFTLSPLFYGLMLLAAGYFHRPLLAPAIVLICWGVAVVLDGKGPLAEGRTAQVHTFGFGLGALLLWLLRDRIDPAGSLQTVAIVMLVVAVWYYFVDDFPVLERAWLWSAVFLLGAAATIAGGLVQRRAAATV